MREVEEIVVRSLPRSLRAMIAACMVEFPFFVVFASIGNKPTYRLWERVIVLYHSLAHGIVYALDVWSGTFFASHSWVYFPAVFLLQSLLLTPLVYLFIGEKQLT